MDIRFLKGALFGGMTSNAFKLGTVLSLGWFWMRCGGCMIFYRGSSLWSINFDNILVVARRDNIEISMPEYLLHEAGHTYFYLVRRTNCCGYLEHGLSGVAEISIDSEGDLAKPKPNGVFGLKAEHCGCDGVRLSWYYCPNGQQSEPVCFEIYSDDGCGEIDYEDAIASIEYKGRGFYSCRIELPDDGIYRFSIRAEDKTGTGGCFSDSMVELVSQVVGEAKIYSVEAV